MVLDPTREHLDSLSQSLIEAELSFDIWWEILNSETALDYIIELDRYSMFLRQTLDAHFQRLVVTLYRVFENNKKSINIPKLLQELYSNNGLSENTRIEINKLREKINKVWRKITILRSNIYGHRSNKLSLDDSFNRAFLKPKDIKSLFTSSQKLLKLLYLEIYNLDYVFNLEATTDTRMLFHDLKKLR